MVGWNRMHCIIVHEVVFRCWLVIDMTRRTCIDLFVEGVLGTVRSPSSTVITP